MVGDLNVDSPLDDTDLHLHTALGNDNKMRVNIWSWTDILPQQVYNHHNDPHHDCLPPHEGKPSVVDGTHSFQLDYSEDRILQWNNNLQSEVLLLSNMLAIVQCRCHDLLLRMMHSIPQCAHNNPSHYWPPLDCWNTH